ncbi:MAG: peptidase T [Elusimicrobiaceae bacterium]|nr:peptidase T [Elusimicrobiaceae bacterium]
MNDLQQKIYNRLVRYVAFDTTSDPNSSVTPTTDSQISFAHQLAAEMKKIGIKDVEVDEYGFVTGLIPPTTDKKAPTIGLFAHMDTVSDYNGHNIRPVLHENYQGGPLVINQAKNMVLTEQNAPRLAKCIGDNIVTADGNTLLGADDKLGIAIIMTLAEHLLTSPQILHGPVKVAFTIDEETGTGISYFDVKKFAADFAYTIDGANLGDIDCGNFNADSFVLRITGKSCHPGSAKGFMANPVRIAADIIASWPETKLPETTDEEDGFILFKDITGGLEKAEVQGIVREHDLTKFSQFKQDLLDLLDAKRAKYPAAKIEVEFKEQYRNMRDILRTRPQAMELLQGALQENNVSYRLTQARGGTDGAQMTFKGLPTPNIFAGYENPHGPYEWCSLNWAERVLQVLRSIAQNAVK